MQKPIYASEDEQLLMTKLWTSSLKDDPYRFVLFCFPWGVANTPLANFKGPRKWQKEVLQRLSFHIMMNKGQLSMAAMREAVASGRGIGKSALVSWLILWMLTTRIGSTVIVSANSENQLRSVTWGELTKWTTMAINAHWWEISATKLIPAAWITELVERDLKKGTRYWAAEGKLWSEESPDSYAGVHNYDGMMVIFDEASGIPDSIWSVAAGFFTENILDRYWFAFSNPRRNTGYFFECFNGKRDYWGNTQIDARSVEGTDKAVYDQIISEYGDDSKEAKIEVYGEFPAIGDGQFISPVDVDDAFQRKRWSDQSAPVVIGIDPARHGDDSTWITVRQGRDINRQLKFDDPDTMTIVGRIIDIMREEKPTLTVIDEGGLGYGILDRLNELGYKVKGVNFGWKSKNPKTWGNKRAEMWGNMRTWLKTASIPQNKRLKVDLTGPKEKPDSAGRIFLESKKEMKARGLASPDSADSIAVTFAYPVANKEVDDIKIMKRARSHYGFNGSVSWMGA